MCRGLHQPVAHPLAFINPRASDTQVASLEEQLRLAAQEIVSFIESEPMLKQTSHAQKLEDNPEWGLILGLGYNTSAQKQSLVYKHLRKLVDSLRVITAGDALKAKQLAEMLFMRMHSGARACSFASSPPLSFALIPSALVLN